MLLIQLNIIFHHYITQNENFNYVLFYKIDHFNKVKHLLLIFC